MLARRLIVLSGMVFGTIAPIVAVAEPRDAVERSQRLDTDALRDDIRTNRLRVPSHPLVIAPQPQPTPISKGKKKKSASGSSN
ncbi:hypothetical protein [Bradyrhizobium sp.]|jgi:hypothetical protein|uniref:hypothetical protein n=1 Tax=Bradyrhizobium sp. TaxID=376 RepID=UPI002DDD3E00|nr:hypothetical protein [Bradyrhizobium sp.]HEV2159944.1 hypothetical protein [Bradyrhizobium sp.]